MDVVTERGAAAAQLRANSDAILQRLEDEGHKIQSLRTDAAIAKEIRDELTPLLDVACKILSKASAEGFEVGWVVQPDSFGRAMRCTEITIKKLF